MMISPEAYYEFELKGKDRKTILSHIRSLKREIDSLKKELENSANDTGMMILPSPLTRIRLNREYLEMTKRAYAEAGGVYTPTKKEMKAIAFDQSLDAIEKLFFEMNGFAIGYDRRTYTIYDDSVQVNIDKMLPPYPKNPVIENAYTREEFISGLKDIHIGEWKRRYVDKYIEDGGQWELCIHFKGELKPVKIIGSNRYPYNFDDLLELLGMNTRESEEDEV